MLWRRIGCLCFGLAMLLYGLALLSRGLQTALGRRLQGLLEHAAATPLRGAALGAVATAVIQSSSAVTVLAVSLADTGVVAFRQAASIIVGANVGTTATAWLLALRMDGGNSGLLLPILAGSGLLLWLLGRGEAARGGGMALTALAAVFFDLELLAHAMGDLADDVFWSDLLTSPWRGLLLGAGMTAVLQSSSACMGMLQALAASGGICVGEAVPLVLGQNIGTCVTALLAAFTAGRMGRLAALWHLAFNLAGAAVCFALFWPMRNSAVFASAATPWTVAALHTGFNLAAAAVALPLLERYGRGKQRYKVCRPVSR